MRKAILGVLVAVLAVLAAAPLVGADQPQTMACCGGTSGFPYRASATSSTLH